MEVGHLLVEWRGPPVNQRARIPLRWSGGVPCAGVGTLQTHPSTDNGGAGNNNSMVMSGMPMALVTEATKHLSESAQRQSSGQS